MYKEKTEVCRHQGEIRISVLTSLYKCKQHLHQYFKHVSQISNLKECEFVFIHNDPSEEEKVIIFNHLAQNETINYLYIPVPREGLYKSWNRGIINAKGKFIAVWNVDDIRFPNSLVLQANALETMPKAGLVYGDKLKANGFNDDDLELQQPKDISKNKWFKPFKDGSLIMWKKEVHDIVGFFDEQFITAGDQEMWHRIGKKYQIVKVNEILGVYYSYSSSLGHVNRGKGEGLIIGLRYGFYKIKGLGLLQEAIKSYSINYYKLNDNYVKIDHAGWGITMPFYSAYPLLKYFLNSLIKKARY